MSLLERFRVAFIEQQFDPKISNPHGFLCLVLNEAYSDFTPEEHEVLRAKILEAKNDVVIMPPLNLLLMHHREPMFAAIHSAYRLGIIDQWIRNEDAQSPH